MTNSNIENPSVVSRDEWLAARKQHLRKEKELTRPRDRLSAERRELPWVKVEKPYVFDGSNGKETLADLFDGRSQLVVKHFMLGPGWKEGCVGCSFEVDHIEGALVHLEHHDVSVVAISRAPLSEIEVFKKRMRWRFKWVSSYGSDFNYDYHVSFTPRRSRRARSIITTIRANSRARKCPALACSTRILLAMFSTPIPLTGAGVKRSLAHTCCSTSRRRAAMRLVPTLI